MSQLQEDELVGPQQYPRFDSMGHLIKKCEAEIAKTIVGNCKGEK